jgi:hypothetical protein
MEVDQSQVQWERVFVEFLADKVDDDFTTMKKALDTVTVGGLIVMIIIGMVNLIINR